MPTEVCKPRLGSSVIYVSGAGHSYPGIVWNVRGTEDMQVDAFVISPFTPPYLYKVPYRPSTGDDDNGCTATWHWPDEHHA